MMFSERIARATYWAIQPLRGKGDIHHCLQLLEQSQWLPQAKLAELSFRKLEALVHHAEATVPYYKDLFAECGFDVGKFQSPEDLKVLPVLTRDNLEKNFEALKSREIGRFHAHESCSSGSTGQPARFMQDLRFDMWCRAHQLRAYGWCGDWKVGERFALVWGSPVYWDRQTVERRVESWLSNRIELNCNNIGRENLLDILGKLIRFKPKLISGYSTALYLITQLAKELDVQIDGLRAIQPNAEITYDYMADEMSKQFGVPVYDKYGSTETNIIAHQSTHDRNLMCIQSENTYVEFVRDDGTACNYGEDGKLVVTTLNNFSMPLIRYQTSDIAAPLQGQCPSGRGFPLMSKVRGRLYDLIQTPSGGVVHPQMFANLFSNFTSVLWFQIVQNEVDTLDIALIMRGNPDPELEKTFLRMINLRTRADFKARFTYLDDVPITKTGKHKLCVCNLDNR